VRYLVRRTDGNCKLREKFWGEKIESKGAKCLGKGETKKRFSKGMKMVFFEEKSKERKRGGKSYEDK
jgi:hypothetical protein